MANPRNKIPACTECELCAFTVLKSLKTQELEDVSNSKINLHFTKGQPIFSKGNMPQGVYALYKGKVKVYKTLPNGSEQIIQLMAPGDVFGYKALLCDEPYTSSASAIEDSLVCLISNETFNLTMEKSHLMKKDLIFKLSEDLDIAQKKIELSNKSARARVIDAVLSILSVYGVQEKTGELNARLTRKDLSALAGLTLETTARTISALKKEGLLSYEGKRIFITSKRDFLDRAEVV